MIVILPTHARFLQVTCWALKQVYYCNGFEPYCWPTLCLDDSRVYLRYHPQNEGKYLGVFPGICNLEKKFNLYIKPLKSPCATKMFKEEPIKCSCAPIEFGKLWHLWKVMKVYTKWSSKVILCFDLMKQMISKNN